MAEYIHGVTDAREVARLEKQARFVAPFSLTDFDAQPGHRVLDLATGVGAMAEQLLIRYPGIALIGVDLNPNQLRQAQKNHPRVPLVQANAAKLPFPSGMFDRVHCSWLLEHVREPLPILNEVRRVLKPGGYCHFIEVDNATFRTSPEFPEVVEAMALLNQKQEAAGGDPYVGQKLDGLFRRAGFADVQIRPAALHGSGDDPAFFRAFMEEFAEIFESADEALGNERVPLLHAAAARLRALPDLPNAAAWYCGVVAKAGRSTLREDT